MKKLTIVALIILLALVAALTCLWRIYLMPTIENSSYTCRLYTPEEYTRLMSLDNLELADLTSVETVTFDLHLEFPFTVPADSLLLVEVSPPSMEIEGGNVYFGQIPPSGNIQVDIPPPPEYPEGYIWRFVLFVPSKSAICVWGLEEDMFFMEKDFPRSWRIKLLTYRWEKERGGGRSTVFEPM